MLIDSQTEDVVGVFQVEALSSCEDRKWEVLSQQQQPAFLSSSGKVLRTSRQVLDDHSSSGVEDDVSTIVEVMQVIAAVEASVAKDVLQNQLLTINTNSRQTEAPGPAEPFNEKQVLTSTTFFFLLTLFFSSLSGSGAARLTGGLNRTRTSRGNSLNSSSDELLKQLPLLQRKLSMLQVWFGSCHVPSAGCIDLSYVVHALLPGNVTVIP